MNRAVCAIASALAILVAARAIAQPGTPPAPEPASLRGDSTQTRKRLAEAEQKIIAGKGADAADDLQRVLDESADDLVSLDGRHYQSARWIAHGLLARLPPDALKAYQDRIDQPAKKLLDRAKRERDPRPLWQLLDRYFVARPADEALLLLGDLLFERGQFRAAENTWRRLLSDAGADVVFPGSKADAALVRARVALAVIFQSDTARAKAEVAAFKVKHANASGTLAGKTGPLADMLQAFLSSPPKLPADATAGTAWPTYAGAPDRAGRVPGAISIEWPSRLAWVEFIPEDPDVHHTGPASPPARQPFGHPVIVDGVVYVADGTRLFGYNLQSGKKTCEYKPLKDDPPRLNVPLAARVPDACCTLTASTGRLYARLGPSLVRAPESPHGKAPEESLIVCLAPQSTPPGIKELWRLSPPEDEKTLAVWEGAPLVSGRRMWAVYAKFEGGRIVHVAACYDPADASQPPGPPAWTLELCDSPLPGAGVQRTRQELLSLAGRHLIFCSNNGAVVAVDAATGRRAWGFRYPRSRKAVNSATGDPTPAVAFGGRVFVAPADGDRVYALDAETGRAVWESGPTEGARILGVCRGRLIVTVTGPLRGIRGLNLDNGSYHDADGGWIQGSYDAPLSYGQGFVTDDTIVWPTRAGLYLLNAGNGRPKSGSPIATTLDVDRGYFGNLAYADGMLVAVTPTRVRAFIARTHPIEPRPDMPPRERFDIAIDRAERALADGNPARARTLLAEVATGDLPAPLRVWAAARLLQLTPPARDPAQLPPEVRDALRPALLNEWVFAPDGVPVTLDTLRQRHLGHPPVAGSVPVSVPARKFRGPALDADADVAHKLKLPSAVFALGPIPGAATPPKRMFAVGSRLLIAVPIDRSVAREFYTPADLLTHAADLRDGFVAAGPFAVALYGADREPLWVFRVPITDPLPRGTEPFRIHSEGEVSTPHLSAFTLAGPWLLARIGERHLIALDLSARRVAWVLNASGRGGYDPYPFPTAPRFGPNFGVTEKFIVVQLSDGHRWFVSLQSGRPTMLPALGELTARVWWPHVPPRAGENCLFVADGPGLVRLLQLDGRVKWAYEVEREDGLTGEPAQVRPWGDVLLVAVRRNHGVEIERVDPTDGKPMWSGGPAFADANRIDLQAADADKERAYVPTANKLLALTLASGKTAWEAELPDSHGCRGWIARAGKGCVIAYPAEAIPAEPPGVVWDRLARSFREEPFVWRLPGLASTLYDAWVARVVPVLLFDPETGKRIGRIDIPARGPVVAVWFDANTAVIATGDRVVWIK